MASYRIMIKGMTPLLFHNDDVKWADKMEQWRKNPDNKKFSKAGDDRTPGFTWIGYLHHDDHHIAIPIDMIMSCLKGGGAMVPVPGARGNKTFKAQTQSGCLFDSMFLPLQVNGKVIPIEPFMKVGDDQVLDFSKTEALANEHGFTIFVKRASVNSTKHVRARPKFHNWSAEGILNVWDEQLTKDNLQLIFDCAGKYKGIGDWRPGAPKSPGPHGMFETIIEPV